MKSYLPGQSITVGISIVDGQGQPLEVTAGSYRVLDALGVELKPATDLGLTAPALSVNVTVDTAENTLATGVITDLRTIELTLTAAFGQHMQLESYVLAPIDPLVVGYNSFMTYTMAEFVAAQLPAAMVGGWAQAGKDDRCHALVMARDQLCQLQYRYVRDRQSQLIVDHPVVGLSIYDLTDYTAAEIAALPAGMQAALRRAQLVQADHLLGGSNPIEQAREAGLLSHTVGESSSMFRPGMSAPKYPVCEAALKLLTGYLRNPFLCTIGRA